jgi:hypothetical protein
MTEAVARRGGAGPRALDGVLSALGPARVEWLLVAVGSANLIVLLVQAHAFVHGVYLNSDNASALVLPALASHASAGSIVNLGDHAWYEFWWFMRATVGLPHHRQLWEAAPFAVGLLGIASVAAATWGGAGRTAGLLCATVLLSTSAAMRSVLFVPEARVSFVLHEGVLCGSLMFVYDRMRAGRLTPATLFGVGVPLALFTGAGLTDQLLVVGGLAPFVLAPLACWLRLRSAVWRKVSLFAIVTGAASLLLAAILTHIMSSDHVIHAPFPIDFVSSETLITNQQNLLAAFASLGGGSFFGGPASGENLLTFTLGALTLLALLGVLRSLWRWATSNERSAATASARPPAVETREVFIAYWGLTIVLILAAYALTTVSGNSANGRYLLGPWVAVAALLGAFVSASWARGALILAVCAFGVLTLRANLANGVPAYGIGPDQKTAREIERFVLANGATTGYAGYWDAAPVTWETYLGVKVYPVWACPTGGGLCPFRNNQISSWYTPRAHSSTFLLTDSRPGNPIAVAAPLPAFGPPSKVGAFGAFTVYVYGHDLAADLGAS